MDRPIRKNAAVTQGLKIGGFGNVSRIGHVRHEILNVLYDGALIGIICVHDQIFFVALLVQVDGHHAGNATKLR